MIERLQKLSAELFKNALKTYTANDVLIHKRAHANNIPQMLGLFPNKGVGFKVMKKHWYPCKYFEIKRAVYKSHRNAHFYGYKFHNNQTKDEHPHRFNGLSKRGVWAYDLGTFEEFTTDNGVKYTRKDYESFINIRRLGKAKQQKAPQQAEEKEEEKEQTDG